MAEKVLNKLKREEEEKGLKKANTREEQGNHLLQVFGREVSGMPQKRTSCFGDECGDAGGGLENEDQTAGRRRRRKERSAIFAYQENQVFHENYMRTGVRMLLRTGLVPARAWRGQAVGISPAEKAEVEEASGSSSRKEGVGFALTYHGSEQVGSGGRILYHGHACSGARGLVGKMVKKKSRRHGGSRSLKYRLGGK